MPLYLKQVSPLEKVCLYDNTDCLKSKNSYTALAGQRVSYQIVIKNQDIREKIREVWIESPLKENIRLYAVKEVIVDKPSREPVVDEDYLLTSPGMLPDVLVPLEHQGSLVAFNGANVTIWVKLDIPTSLAPGKYPIEFFVKTGFDGESSECESISMQIEVLSAKIPDQKLKYTRWFYADCIADAHSAEIFSERHWMLIEKYIAAATDVGINMILVPIHTPPLDTEVGTRRPCVQLVDIEKRGEDYFFDFGKFRRFIEICKRNGVKYYEMAHLFSQWGSKCAPNILVTENGKSDYKFGWHVAADSEEYTSFLKQYIAAISEELEREGIAEQTYFHVSDEPKPDNLDRYEIARNIIKPLIGNSKTLDALSHCEFYEKGLVECPVTSVRNAHEFISRNVEELWVYYCCGPERVFPNSFIAMPSARVRALGFLLYKYDIKGFLHWGFNFYNSQVSMYKINPYLTTSSDGAFPSGDAFIVYPGRESAYPSIRGEITFEAMQDVRICQALEALIGKQKVVEMIDGAAGRNIRFDDYPANNDFFENLREEMLAAIAKNTK